ncbi:hypothetical protein C0995_005175 [Termitomyces sp. Mi166|nr:hypothetical protein C0995_005175 [Termitomyces sp. Mi166\
MHKYHSSLSKRQSRPLLPPHSAEMKSVVVAAVLGALAVNASPLQASTAGMMYLHPKITPNLLVDINTLNFALTLEHVEVAFYTMGLRNYTEQDFRRAGLPAGARTQFLGILENEAAHVAFLEGLLGTRAVRPCTYKFPVDSPKSFAALSQVIENVGTGAYTGAIDTLSQQYITGSASILGTEARQASLLASYVNGVEGWGNPFNIPLTKNQAFTLAAPFFVDCPSSNPPLVGVRANPSLTFPSNSNPGQTVSVEFESVNSNRKHFAVFLFGLEQIVVPVNKGRVTIPERLAGQVYCLISDSPNGVTDGTTVAGPAVLQFQYTLTGEYIENR